MPDLPVKYLCHNNLRALKFTFRGLLASSGTLFADKNSGFPVFFRWPDINLEDSRSVYWRGKVWPVAAIPFRVTGLTG